MNHRAEFADLHIHTNHSDGCHSSAEIIGRAKRVGLDAIAITDHDAVSAIPEVRKHAVSADIEVLAGVELSVTYKHYDLHILGYGFDENDRNLLEYLTLFQDERVKRARQIVEKLARLGMPISFNAVLEKAGGGTLGRPHIANVLVEDRFVLSFQEAFNRFLGTGKPAYVAKYRLTVDDAINLIHNAGGICAIAHPGIQLREEDILELVKLGIEGIEVVHPKHSAAATDYYRVLAQNHGLLQTGGSDFHGGAKGEETFGVYRVPYVYVEKIKEIAQNR